MSFHGSNLGENLKFSQKFFASEKFFKVLTGTSEQSEGGHLNFRTQKKFFNFFREGRGFLPVFDRPGGGGARIRPGIAAGAWR